MMSTNTNNERESDRKDFFDTYSSSRRGSVAKRLLGLMMMTICLVFAGARPVPTAKASAGCEIVCGTPYIDPTDGRCYMDCCPIDEECRVPCTVQPCIK